MMTPEQEKQAEEWLDRKHWAEDPCPEHPGHDESTCTHCGRYVPDIHVMGKSGPLDEHSKHDIYYQTGVRMKDWSEYRKYLKDNNQHRQERGEPQEIKAREMKEWVEAGGSAAGLPLPPSLRPKPFKSGIDIRKVLEEYGE